MPPLVSCARRHRRRGFIFSIAACMKAQHTAALCSTPPPSALRKAKRMEGILDVCATLQEEWGSLALDCPDLRFGAISTACVSGASNVHGRGVFAARKLHAGTVVTLYPAHALGDSSSSFAYGEIDLASTDYRVALPPSPGLRDWATDLWVDAAPSRALAPGFLGHLVNDAFPRACSSAEEDYTDAVVRYYTDARERASCLLLPFGDTPLLCLTTVRDVEQGTELLSMYGHEYWVDQRSTMRRPEGPSSPAAREAEAAWETELRLWRRRVQESYAAEIDELRDVFSSMYRMVDTVVDAEA